MERSNWGRKPGQEHILAVRMTRSGWEEALSSAVLTAPDEATYADHDEWRRLFDKALVHVQWDPERSIRGASLGHRSIQVGLSRHVIRRYVDEWVVDIKDYTPMVRKMYELLQSGRAEKAGELLPEERPYPVADEIGKRLGVGGSDVAGRRLTTA